MSSLENELQDLKEKNTELVQKVQYWKMTAAQRENDNIELMKEVTELRLKLSRLSNSGEAQANKLEKSVQKASEEALSYLVQASNAVARNIEFVKTYIKDRQELEASLPRWSCIGEGSSSKKINKVKPLIGGRTVQPLVLLDRTLDGNLHTTESSQNQNHFVTERAIPMHMLLDVYIPLRRIDADSFPGNNEHNDLNERAADDSVEALGLEEADDRALEESQSNMEEELFQESRHLEAVSEDMEPGEEEESQQRAPADNPLEGPSWLLDRPGTKMKSRRTNLEPDSTTDVMEEGGPSTRQQQAVAQIRSGNQEGSSASGPPGSSGAGPGVTGLALPGDDVSVFSPTVRRRRRASPAPVTPPSPVLSPRFSPRPSRRLSTDNNGRILKVLVAKMRLNDDERDADGSPGVVQRRMSAGHQFPVRETPKRRSTEGGGYEVTPQKRPTMRFDAPSPNGATDARVIVMDSNTHKPEPCTSGLAKQAVNNSSRRRADSRDSLMSSLNSGVSDASDTEMLSDSRPKRQKKTVVYKEKPLNRKMRR